MFESIDMRIIIALSFLNTVKILFNIYRDLATREASFIESLKTLWLKVEILLEEIALEVRIANVLASGNYN